VRKPTKPKPIICYSHIHFRQKLNISACHPFPASFDLLTIGLMIVVSIKIFHFSSFIVIFLHKLNCVDNSTKDKALLCLYPNPIKLIDSWFYEGLMVKKASNDGKSHGKPFSLLIFIIKHKKTFEKEYHRNQN
jgi:hypothetical protein